VPLLHGPSGTDILEGGAPFYDTYICKDGRWMSVGCIEPHFFRIFLEVFMKALPRDCDPCHGWKPEPSTQFKQEEWSKLGEYLTKGFLTHPRDFWGKIFLGMLLLYFRVYGFSNTT
jgi:alpha-methylacyl-CoA racemase